MASTILTRTVTSTGNNKILTWSGWVKRSDNSTGQLICANGDPTTSNYVIFFEFTGGNLRFIVKSSSILANVQTNAVFQDLSAWYHLVFTMDTTQATDSDRVKMYVNGEQITDFALATYPSLNETTQFNNADSVISVGGKYVSGANTDFFNGSMSHVHFIDGTVYDPSAFGETDTTTGQWKIKTSPSVTYGTNGFFILKDGNSVTDQSGEGNNLTVGGGTLTNTEDSPSNVFAALNPLFPSITAFENGATSLGSTSDNQMAISTLGGSDGAYYAEMKLGNSPNGGTGYAIRVGIVNLITENLSFSGMGGHASDASPFYGVQNVSGGSTNYFPMYNNGSVVGTTGIASTSGDIIMIAWKNNKLYMGKNGTWFNSGDPENETNQLWTLPSGGTWGVSVMSSLGGASDSEFNFGNGYFGTTAVSSAGTNASGNGIFEYDVPTGYTALSTKGLNL